MYQFISKIYFRLIIKLIYKIVFYFSFLLSVYACFQANEPTLLFTNNLDVIPWVEWYNQTNPKQVIAVYYNTNLSQVIKNQSADIMIYNYWPNLESEKYLSNLNSLLDKKAKDNLYPFLQKDMNKRYFPLSFDLGIILYTANTDNLSLIKDVQEIYSSALAYNKTFSDNSYQVGFSSLWNLDFIKYLLLNLFHKIQWSTRTLEYDEKEINTFIDFLKQWKRDNKKIIDIDFFNQRYIINDNLYTLLINQTILYAYSTLSQLIKLDEFIQRQLNFSYLSNSDTIIPIQVNYIFVNKKSRNKSNVKKFVQMISSMEEQKKFINQLNSSANFLGMLSSLKDINEDVYVQKSPFWLKKILPQTYLTISKEKLREKESFILDKALIPWIINQVNEYPSSTDLKVLIQSYYK